MEIKYLILILLVFITTLIVIIGFSIYTNSKTKEIKGEVNKDKGIAENVVEPPEQKDIIPEEENIPAIEETEKKIEIIYEANIIVNDLGFYPKEIIIKPGTNVIWFNNGTTPLKIVSYDRLFSSSRLNPGNKYNFAFIQEGTYSYFDAVFPKIRKGKIIVKEI